MKDIKKLKNEQQELKDKLKKLIDFMNSEEFFSVSEKEQTLLSTQRAGMEMYLTALTNRLYLNADTYPSNSTSTMLPLLFGLMNMPSGYNSSYSRLTKEIDEMGKKIEEPENNCGGNKKE